MSCILTRVDWDEILDLEEEWEQIERPPSRLPPIRTPAYRAARKRRIEYLRRQIETGSYRLPSAEKVAWHILYGRLRWGEALIDKQGRRVDRC